MLDPESQVQLEVLPAILADDAGAAGSDFFLPLASESLCVRRDALIAPREREWGLSWIDRD